MQQKAQNASIFLHVDKTVKIELKTKLYLLKVEKYY